MSEETSRGGEDFGAQILTEAVKQIMTHSGLINAHDIAPNGLGDMECAFLGEIHTRISIGSPNLPLDCFCAATTFFWLASVCSNPEVKAGAEIAGEQIMHLADVAYRARGKS